MASLLVRTTSPSRSDSAGKPALVAQLEEELHACRARRPRAPPAAAVKARRALADPGAGPLGGDPPAAARERLDVGHLGVGVHDRPVLLGEVQVVAVERVLGADAAARPCSCRSGCSRPGRGPRRRSTGRATRSPGLPNQTPTGVRWYVSATPSWSASAVHVLVGRGVGRDLVHAEHALGLVVERRQLGPPVGDVAPLRVGVEGSERLVERVGVDERPAAHARAGEDRRCPSAA